MVPEWKEALAEDVCDFWKCLVNTPRKSAYQNFIYLDGQLTKSGLKVHVNNLKIGYKKFYKVSSTTNLRRGQGHLDAN